MRINQTNSSPVQANDASSARRSESAKAKAYASKADSASSSSKTTESANAEISSRAKDMAKAAAVANDTSDTRESKIAALREAIQNKKYNVSASDIADRLVDDHVRMAGA